MSTKAIDYRKKVNCPCCLGSSGFMPFMGLGKSQVCWTCRGTGVVSKRKEQDFVKEFGQ